MVVRSDSLASVAIDLNKHECYSLILVQDEHSNSYIQRRAGGTIETNKRNKE